MKRIFLCCKDYYVRVDVQSMLVARVSSVRKKHEDC